MITLQKAKTIALDIENNFTKIALNDLLKELKTKQDIFNDLKLENDLIPKNTYFNMGFCKYEMLADNELDFVTIHILQENVIKKKNARH